MNEPEQRNLDCAFAKVQAEKKRKTFFEKDILAFFGTFLVDLKRMIPNNRLTFGVVYK